jgi:hypothetical protein
MTSRGNTFLRFTLSNPDLPLSRTIRRTHPENHGASQRAAEHKAAVQLTSSRFGTNAGRPLLPRQAFLALPYMRCRTGEDVSDLMRSSPSLTAFKVYLMWSM